VQASHEAAIVLRNLLAEHTGGKIWTNRYPHTDHFHIEMDQDAAAGLVRALLHIPAPAGEEHSTMTISMRPGDYPEHAKQEEVRNDAETIGDFLVSSKYELGEWCDIEGYHQPRFMPVSTPIQQILAEYLGIDLNKIEAEKRAMLAALAAATDTTP
jgi:hypothetical protein